MHIKRILWLLLCISVLTGMLVGCGNQEPTKTEGSTPTEGSTQPIVSATENNTIDYATIIDSFPLDSGEKIELLVAQELCFPMENLTNSTITGTEYAVLLDKLIEYAAPDKLSDWKTHHIGLRSHGTTLTRSEAMAALYLAADFIGGYYDDFQMRNMEFHQTVEQFWDLAPISSGLFDAEIMERDDFYGGDFGNDSYLDGASMSFCSARISEISGEFLFSYDAEKNSFQPFVAPTYAEALMSVIRLISSAEPDLWEYEPSELDQIYLDMAETRRNEIANTVTDCAEAVTGRIYYISNDGDDGNDGLSPETAWATVAPVWSGVIQSGDAILFERGGEWYLTAPEGCDVTNPGIEFSALPGSPRDVTVGAYGDGEKPLLRGDIPDSNDASFWTLYSDEDGVKIWKSTTELMGVPVIVFNDGESWADSIMPWISSDRTYFMHPDGEKFTLENGLTEDLTFVWLPELTEDLANVLMADRVSYFVTAPVYLRCDAGNPAEVFDAVSLPQTSGAIALNKDCSAYDLSIRYFSMTGISVTSDDNYSRGQTFQNLEVGWCGGFLDQYSEQCDADGCYGYSPFIAGGGIHIQTNADLTLTGCHVHNCGPMATILSMHTYPENTADTDVWKNHLIADNLFESCCAAGHIADFINIDNPNVRGFLTNYVFENNLVMYSGYGWVRRNVMQCLGGIGNANGGWLSAVENEYSAGNNDGIYFRNNVFYRSSYALLAIRQTLSDGSPVNMDPIFEGNTYVQLSTLPLLMRHSGSEFYYPSDQVMQGLVGDKTGTLVILEP